MFPTTPRDTVVELFVNGGWTDITSDVYARDGLTITRGGRDETSRIEPSSCRFTLNNRSGNYSPRNVNGLYYGSVGRNTPLRVSIRKDLDTFTRTVSNGWGSTTNGTPWGTLSSGGTITAADFNVGSGVGTISLTAAGNFRFTYLPGVLYGDVDVVATFSASASAITGALLDTSLLLRGVDINNYLLVFCFVDPATNRYFLAIYSNEAGNLVGQSGADYDTGVTYAANTPVKLRAAIEGTVVTAKLWAANTVEPYGWQVFGGSGNVAAAGWVGIRTTANVGNTNTKPITISVDNVTIRVPRFAGEIAYWPQRWDESGHDFYVPLEASGVKRRLGQGSAPVQSAMRTSVLSLTSSTVLAYWPCEDGADSTQVRALIGTAPLGVVGTVKFADFGGFNCSLPLPSFNGGSFQGRISAYTAGTGLTFTHLLHMTTSEPADDQPISRFFTTGSVNQWELHYRTGGKYSLVAYASGTLVWDTGPIAFFDVTDTLLDRLWMLSVTLQQVGANINISTDFLKVGSTLSGGNSGTLNSRTFGNITSVTFDPNRVMTGVSVGHILVRNTLGNIFDTSHGLNAFSGPAIIGGETALARMDRLTFQEGLAFEFRGTFAMTPLVGPQRPLPLLTLLEEAGDADMGLLHEARSASSLYYRAQRTLYNQTPVFSLDYNAGQVAPPLEPVDDDQQTRNDITATRTDGSSFELFLSSGRLAVTNPWQGGVGVYTDAVTVNVDFDTQLPDVAGWRLLTGTVDEARYPTITVRLHSQAVSSVANLDNQILSANAGDRLQITNLPALVTPNAIDQIARGYTEVIEPFSHTITFVCAPASPYNVLQPTTAGLMTVDSGASTLAAPGATTTATTLSVAVATGSALWITGSVNFDIVIEGERVTVTNISGASSPQTFTVTRSVNGVVKAHAAGVAVALYRASLVGR